MDPLNWVPAIPNPTSGYPIVGFITMEISTCYKNKSAGTAISKMLNDVMTLNSPFEDIVENNGFVPLRRASYDLFATAVNQTFLNNQSGFGLNIDNVTVCSSYRGR